MIYDYVVTLRNERKKWVDRISIITMIFSAIAFFSVFIRTGTFTLVLVIASLFVIAGLVWIWVQKKKRKEIYYSRILLAAAFGWFAMSFLSWIGLLLLLLSLLERPAKQPLEIGFTKDRIVFNTLLRKKFTWQDFQNIILKDGLLTLDFKNNRLIQRPTIDEEADADEEEFNEYCTSQLKLAQIS